MPPAKCKKKQTQLADLGLGKFISSRPSALPRNQKTRQANLYETLKIPGPTKPAVHEDKENKTIVSFSKSLGRFTKETPSSSTTPQPSSVSPTEETFPNNDIHPKPESTKEKPTNSLKLKRKTLSPQRPSQADFEDDDNAPSSSDELTLINHRRIIHPPRNFSQQQLQPIVLRDSQLKTESQVEDQAQVVQQLQREVELHTETSNKEKDSHAMPPPPLPRPALKRTGPRRNVSQAVEIQEGEKQRHPRRTVNSSQWYEREEDEILQTQTSNLSNSSLELMRGSKRRRLQDEEDRPEQPQARHWDTQPGDEDTDSPLSECPPGLLSQQEPPNSYQDPPTSTADLPPPRLPTRQNAVIQPQEESQQHDSIPATQPPKIVLDSQFPDEDDFFPSSSPPHEELDDVDEESIPETQYAPRYESTQPSQHPSHCRNQSSLGEVQVPHTQYGASQIQVPRTQCPSDPPPISQLNSNLNSDFEEPNATFCPIVYERELRRQSREGEGGNPWIRMPREKFNFTQFPSSNGGTQFPSSNGGTRDVGDEDEVMAEVDGGPMVNLAFENEVEEGSQDTVRPTEGHDSQDTKRPHSQSREEHQGSQGQPNASAENEIEQDSMLPTMSQLLPNSLMESFPMPPAVEMSGDWDLEGDDPDATQ